MTNNPAGYRTPRDFTTKTSTGRPDGLAGRIRLRAASPDAVLAIVPHMLGFYPSRSMVVLGLGDRGRVVVTFRYDLPDPADADLAGDIAGHASFVLERERLTAAMLVGYGPADLVAPVAMAAGARLATAGIQVQEILRADGGRYWSLLCADPACCPPEGRHYDPGSHPAAAAMTGAGLAAEPDRDALARTLRRPPGSADLINAATSSALLRLAQLTRLAEAAGDGDLQLRATRVGRREVRAAIRAYRSGRVIRSLDRLAWLAVLLADIRVRDDAWARMDPAHREAHLRLWTDVVRAAAFDYLPAPASLLAFTAWQTGNGALATMAVDRALSADPVYSMALLISDAVTAALPPSAARLPMSPAQVAASYRPPVGRRAVPGDAVRRTRPGAGRAGRPGPVSAGATGDSAGCESGQTVTARRQPIRKSRRARRGPR